MPRLLASACRQVPQQLASADSELLKVLFGFSTLEASEQRPLTTHIKFLKLAEFRILGPS